MNYLTANAKLRFSSLQDGEAGRRDTSALDHRGPTSLPAFKNSRGLSAWEAGTTQMEMK